MNRRKYKWRRLCCGVLVLAAVLACGAGVLAQSPNEKEEMLMRSSAVQAVFGAMEHGGEGEHTLPVGLSLCSADLSAIDISALNPQDLEDLRLCPGGMPFGVRFITEGVSVVGFCDIEVNGTKMNPAAEAGLKLRDVILKVNGEPLLGASQLTDQIEKCDGKELVLLCQRRGEEVEIHLNPVYFPSEARYKTGIWVRDSGAGIGTVTFILPETGAFAGLGHGICDADTGELIPMKRGTVSDVTISAVVKGTAGAPGELKGYFNPGKTGSLLGNSACGVWGVFSEIPEGVGETMPIGLRSDVTEGDAYILSTLDSNKTERYDVQISNIRADAQGSKCFTVKITDPDLLAASGGIVQGMSGSPIIQNGKLIGAVTHVLVGDPTTGYGIFVENMLVGMPIPAR